VTGFCRDVLNGAATIVPSSDAFGRCLERIAAKGKAGYRWRPSDACP
jgi:hypothetical protein